MCKITQDLCVWWYLSRSWPSSARAQLVVLLCRVGLRDRGSAAQHDGLYLRKLEGEICMLQKNCQAGEDMRRGHSEDMHCVQHSVKTTATQFPSVWKAQTRAIKIYARCKWNEGCLPALACAVPNYQAKRYFSLMQWLSFSRPLPLHNTLNQNKPMFWCYRAPNFHFL